MVNFLNRPTIFPLFCEYKLTLPEMSLLEISESHSLFLKLTFNVKSLKRLPRKSRAPILKSISDRPKSILSPSSVPLKELNWSNKLSQLSNCNFGNLPANRIPDLGNLEDLESTLIRPFFI